jgi:GGDEF domain-containing protein
VHALLLIDIDLFKQTNDRFGHAAGDAVLVAIARRLRETLRETDIIVRWGGEEFWSSFRRRPRQAGRDRGAHHARHRAGADPYKSDRIQVTASIGYAPMPLPPEDVHLPWERAGRSRRHGALHGEAPRRNCGYGIRRLRRSDDEAMARIERNLESAWANGMVEMHLEPGPDVEATDDASPDPPGAAPVDDTFSENAERRVA